MIDLSKSSFHHHVRVVKSTRMTLSSENSIDPAHIDDVFNVAYDEAVIQKDLGYNFTQVSVNIDSATYYVVCNSISYED